MSDNDKLERAKLLLEEWKQNVVLYIDQDKRGFDRIKMFLAMHAGLLVLYSAFWDHSPDGLSVFTGWLIASVAVFLTVITRCMSKQAHAFILLRKTQGMLIESKIKDLLMPDAPWRTSEGVITTFTREHVAFLNDEDAGDWKSLRQEIYDLGDYPAAPFKKQGFWKTSMGHLKWLLWVYTALCVFWILLGVAITTAWYMTV